MRSLIAMSVVVGALALAPAAFAGDESGAPAPADQTCAQQQTNNTVAGAAIGAVVGGVVGNNVAGRHHHGAGTALGAVAGGVTGGVIGHNATNCDPAPAPVQSDAAKPMDDGAQPPADDSSAPPPK
jgi:uncharacterized membrane protein YebE (DUF533 family)